MKLELFGYTISIEKRALADEQLPQDLQEALKVLEKYSYKAPPSPKKTESAHRATAIRQARTKEKIQNAINLLKMQGEDITAYRVAKTAQVSYNTAKKYLQGQNKTPS